MALLLVSAALAPLEFRQGRSGLSVCLLLAAFLCGFWILRMVVVQQRVVFDRSRIVVAALAFMAVAALSFVIGQYPWFPTEPAPMRAQVGGLMVFLLSGGLFLLVGHTVRSLAQLRYLTWVFVGASAATLLTMLIPGLDIGVGSIAITSHSSVGSLFFIWIVATSVAQALWNRSLPPLARFLLMAVAGLALARALFLTFSWSSGWLPTLVALGTLLFLRFPRLTLASALLVTTPALIVSVRAWEALMVNESYSFMTRIEALWVMLDVIQYDPWFGFGPANYPFYTPLFSILGYRIKFNSHNNYIDLLAQTGVIGLLAFCWFATEALRLALRIFGRQSDGFERAYAAGAVAGIVGSLVAGLLADWIVPFVYNIGLAGFRSSLLFWFFPGGLLALGRLSRAGAGPRPAMATPCRQDLALTL